MILPLFPLGTVLFPGLVLPLHVFEERYRSLVRDLIALPTGTPREFGVVAIERGLEVAEPPTASRPGARSDVPDRPGGPGGLGRPGGSGGPRASDSSAAAPSPGVTLYPVGCSAEVRQITSHEDGRFDLVTVGRRRFEITQLVPSDTPYLQADVRYLPESTDERDTDQLGPRVLAAFRVYLSLVRTQSGELSEQLPDDPVVLSHLVAATASLTLADRQALLATPDTAQRLRAELALLHREVNLLRQVRAVPVTLAELTARPGFN